MTLNEPAPTPVRGQNPEPASGWPWYLTDYEVAYVRVYNVRPPRSGSWPAAPDAEQRLEQEADGVRAQFRSEKTPWRRRRVERAWPWVAVTAVVLAGAVALGVGGYLELQQVQATTHKTQEIKEALSND